MRGLAELETVLLTEWWEGTGPIVKRFWREIRRARLRYQPRDILAEIGRQGRIRTREQYDFAVDMIGELEWVRLFRVALDGRSFDHLTSFRCGRDASSGLGMTPSA